MDLSRLVSQMTMVLLVWVPTRLSKQLGMAEVRLAVQIWQRRNSRYRNGPMLSCLTMTDPKILRGTRVRIFQVHGTRQRQPEPDNHGDNKEAAQWR